MLGSRLHHSGSKTPRPPPEEPASRREPQDRKFEKLLGNPSRLNGAGDNEGFHQGRLRFGPAMLSSNVAAMTPRMALKDPFRVIVSNGARSLGSKTRERDRIFFDLADDMPVRIRPASVWVAASVPSGHHYKPDVRAIREVPQLQRSLDSFSFACGLVRP